MNVIMVCMLSILNILTAANTVLVTGLMGVGKSTTCRLCKGEGISSIELDLLINWTEKIPWKVRLEQLASKIKKQLDTAFESQIILVDYAFGNEDFIELQKIINAKLCIVLSCKQDILIERLRKRHKNANTIDRLINLNSNIKMDYSAINQITIDTTHMSPNQVAKLIQSITRSYFNKND